MKTTEREDNISLAADSTLKINISSENQTEFSISDLEALPDEYQILLEILYSTTAIIALISNILAIILLVNKKRTSSDLRKYLINLALADICMAIFSIPFTYLDFMYGYWKFDPWICPVTQFMTIWSVCVSIFTLTTIGIERYFAIVYPLELCWWSERETLYTIVFIWILSSLIASPMIFHARAVPFVYGHLHLLDCREEWEESASQVYAAILFSITFFIPLIALTFLYGSIGFKTFRHIHPGNSHLDRDRIHQRIKVKVIKMLMTLVSAFLVCWLPIQIWHLVLWFNQDLRNAQTKLHYYLYFGSYFVCHWLSMAHTFVDPFVYCYMSSNFNIDDIRSLLDRRCLKLCRSGNQESFHSHHKNNNSNYNFNTNTNTLVSTNTGGNGCGGTDRVEGDDAEEFSPMTKTSHINVEISKECINLKQIRRLKKGKNDDEEKEGRKKKKSHPIVTSPSTSKTLISVSHFDTSAF